MNFTISVSRLTVTTFKKIFFWGRSSCDVVSNYLIIKLFDLNVFDVVLIKE